MNEDTYTIKTGHLDVGNGHQIYYQQWGNPDGVPVFVLHGGPIYHSKDKHKLAFDPTKHNVIFHDQRGCGQSLSDDIATHNTADDRVGDIERLRKHFSYDTIQVFGFSWGSTLALYYAEQYPKKVSKMIIGGVYTATQAETDVIFQGAIATSHPEAWEYYTKPVPQAHREDTLSFYHERLTDGTDAEKLDLLKRFSQLEPAGMSIDGDYAALRQQADATEDLEELPETILTITWFQNNCYIPKDYIMQHAANISHIPMVVIQGRQDLVCRAGIAHKVKNAIGDNAHLHMLPGAHNIEGAMREVQRAYAWSFLD